MPKSHVVTVHSANQQPLPVSRTDQIKFYFKAGALLLATTAMYVAARATRLLPQWQSGDSSPALPNVVPEVAELSTNQEQTAQITLSLSEEEDIKNAADPLALSGFKSGLTDFQEIQLDTRHISETNIHKRKLLQTSNGSVVVANPIPDQTILVGNPYTYDLSNVFSGNYTILGAVEMGKNSLPPWLNLEYKKVGNYPADGGSVYGITLSGKTVFVANYDVGLKILDVSDLTSPQLLSTYPANNGSIWGVATSANVLFAATNSGNLQIFDVSNLTRPQLLSTYSTGSNGQPWGGIMLSGNILFLANYNAGLQIFNVSNLTYPQLLGVYPTGSGNAFGVAISGDKVFLANDGVGLQILDVNDPTNPQLISTYPPGGGSSALGVAVSQDTVFLASNGQGLYILDISNLASPQLLSTYPAGSSGFWDVTIIENTLFITGGYANLQVLDVSDLRNPRLLSISVISSAVYTFNVVISENRVFIAAFSAGLQILDMTEGMLTGTPLNSAINQRFSLAIMARNGTSDWITDTFALTPHNPPRTVQNALTDQSMFPNQPVVLSFNSEQLFVNPSVSFLQLSLTLVNGKSVPDWLTLRLTPALLSTYSVGNGQAFGVTVSGNTVFIADFNAGLQILDVSNLFNPRFLANYPSSSGYTWNVAISGNVAFMADHFGGLHILNISTLTNPQLLSTYSASSDAVLDVVISGNIAFLADYTAGLKILDVSDLKNPQLISTYPAGSGQTFGVAVSGNTVFIANADSLQALDISNLPNPHLLFTYSSSDFIVNTAVLGNIVFVADRFGGLSILGVNNLTNPQLFNTYSTHPYGVSVLGNRVFLTGDMGLQILDVSNLTNPQLLGTYPTNSGQARDAAISGNTVFMADGTAGLKILDLRTWELIANPTINDVGNYHLYLIATDILGDSVSKAFTIRIEGPPQLRNPLPSQYAKVGQIFYYITPPNTFIDPNFDPLLFSVGTLPAWLNFDSVSAAFTGTPSASDVGVFTIPLTATDPLGGTASDRFNITVTYVPLVTNPLTQALSLVQGRYFTYSVPVNTFYGYGEKLNYTLSNSGDGGLLPSWIQFISENATLSGTPISTGVMTLLVSAQNAANNQASTPLTLIINTNSAPQLKQAISTQTAQVGQSFQFFVPTNTFEDKDGDVLTYTATFLGDFASLEWLTFDPKTVSFRGTPGRSDTNAFSTRVLSILLTASDPNHASANVVFNLNVSGTSNWALFIKIASPVITIVTAAFTFYKKRALCLNRYKPDRYNRIKEEAIVGEAYIRQLETPAQKVALVQAKLSAGKRNCCVKFFKSPRVNLPGGQLLPAWLTYDHRTNSLYSEKGPKKTDIAEDLIIQIKDYADVIQEQFTLKVVLQKVAPQNALDDNQVEAERKDDIPLQVMR